MTKKRYSRADFDKDVEALYAALKARKVTLPELREWLKPLVFRTTPKGRELYELEKKLKAAEHEHIVNVVQPAAVKSLLGIAKDVGLGHLLSGGLQPPLTAKEIAERLAEYRRANKTTLTSDKDTVQ